MLVFITGATSGIGKSTAEIFAGNGFDLIITGRREERLNALKKDLETLTWMTPETRKAALKKLSLMKARVGYPEKWRDYSTLKINRGPYILNIFRVSIFSNQYELNKIGKPVDRDAGDQFR